MQYIFMKNYRILTGFFLFLIVFYGTAQSSRPIITNLQGSVDNNQQKIILTWSISELNSENQMKVALYRQKNRPFTNFIPKNTQPLALIDGNITKFEDTIKDTNAYYYAILFITSQNMSINLIIPGQNATINPLQIMGNEKIQPVKSTQKTSNANKALTQNTKAPLRKTPLPYLQILSENKTLDNLYTTHIQQNAIKIPNVEILPIDKYGDSLDGDDYTLFTIVDTELAQNKNWAEAKKALDKFLEINHDEIVTARAHFYLGQTLYFLNDERNAIHNFQVAQKYYAIPSKKWIEKILDNYLID